MQSLWMVVAAVFYAVYGVCIKFASLEGIGAWEVLFYRSFFGLVVFFIMMHREGTSMRTQHPWAHAVRSLAGVAAIVAGIYSLSHLNLGLAMTLNYTAPLFLGTFVVIWSLLHHSHINWGLMASLAAGFAGVVILLGPTIGPDEYFAAGVGIAAGGFTALATGFVKRLGSYHEPLSRIIFFLMLAGSGRLSRVDCHGCRKHSRFLRLRDPRTAHAHDGLFPRQHGALRRPAVHRHSLFHAHGCSYLRR